MKTMTIIIGLFMLPLLGTTAPTTSSQNISGFWESDCGSISLLIEGDRQGLRVRNSRYGGGWSYYDRARGTSNTYVNGRSKSLRVRSGSTILFEDRRNRTRLTLKKRRNRNNQRGFYNNGYGDRYGSRNLPNRRNDGRFNDRSRRGLYGTGLSARQIRKSIDDSWRNRQFDTRIKIRDTDSGIKMRRGLLNGWTHYLQDYRNPTIFSDSRGNTIEIISKYEIVWFDSRNGRTLYFERD